jgi:hypothetical protein
MRHGAMAAAIPGVASSLGDSAGSLHYLNGDVAYVLDKRRRDALKEIDTALFGWSHVKVVAVAGAGFMTDA